MEPKAPGEKGRIPTSEVAVRKAFFMLRDLQLTLAVRLIGKRLALHVGLTYTHDCIRSIVNVRNVPREPGGYYLMLSADYP